MNVDEKLRELHALGMKACYLAGKDPTNEPRTQYRILPSGKSVIIFYSSCFSFIPANVNQIVISIDDLDAYIDKARREVEMYSQVHEHGFKPIPFKTKADVIPFIVCVGGTRRLYKVHLCKEHRKDRITYRPQCRCYITWEDF